MKGTLGVYWSLQQADKKSSLTCNRERRIGPQYLASRMLCLLLPFKIRACSSQPKIAVMIIRRPRNTLAKWRPRLGVLLGCDEREGVMPLVWKGCLRSRADVRGMARDFDLFGVHRGDARNAQRSPLYCNTKPEGPVTIVGVFLVPIG
jgi:hypothetical protein